MNSANRVSGYFFSLILICAVGCTAQVGEEATLGVSASAALPGAVTNFVVTPLDREARLTWTAPAVMPAITDYLVEYKLSSASTWTTFTHVASASANITVTGLTNASSYDFRVSAINSDGTGTVSSVQSGTPRVAFDQISGTPVVAYSMRRIVSSYLGNAISVRRTDGMTANIGFNAAGGLDTDALGTFCAATACTISTWYDQSGNMRNLNQSTPANQPRIVNAGAIDTSGGRPAMYLNGTTTWITQTTLSLAPPYSSVLVAQRAVTSSGHQRLLSLHAGSDTFGFIGGFQNFYATFVGNGGSWNDVAANTPNTNLLLVPNVMSELVTTGATGLIPYLNGTAQNPKNGTAGTSTGFEVGARYSGNTSQLWNGYVSEVAIFTGLNAVDRAVLERNHGAYYAINVAASAPLAPTSPTGVGGASQAVVSFTPPASHGGAPITTYTVIASPGGVTATGQTSPITVSGLTSGMSYTFTVTATNSAGTSPASTASGSVLIGCASDANCAPTEWCNTATFTCVAKAATGVAIPNSGTCAAGLSSRCLSGVCDADNICGHANGQGGCTTGNASGTSGTCRSGVCDPAAGGGTGLCRQCTASTLTNCSGGTPLCDSITFTCAACNGDNGTAASTTCGAGSPYCPGGGSACTTCGTAGGTTTCAAGGATHAGGVCQPTGACGNACVNDSNCSAVQWCDTGAGPASCTSDLANGVAIPNVPSHTSPVLNGICTAPAASVVCASGVCDSDNACGYADGSGTCNTGNAGTVCRSGTCSANGSCRPAGGCNVDDDCTSAQWCNTTSHMCVAKGATSSAIPGGGTCSGGVSTRCLSGNCDADNICGHANGQGTCTTGTASGTAGDCRSGVCDPTAAGGTGLCRECTSVDASNCGSGTPICDSVSYTCSACNGDRGTSATAACGVALPYCPGAGGACTTCGTAGDTTTCTAAGAMHSGGVCGTTGACSDACVGDSNCMATQWCDTSMGPAACVSDLANNAPIPNIPSHTSPTLNGLCTPAAALAVCASAVCDTTDNRCGYAIGSGTCTIMNGPTVCRSGACGVTGVCIPPGGCASDGDCNPGTEWCDTATNICESKAITGAPIPGGASCVDGESSRCLSGVCDSDNVCGHANGTGPCSTSSAAGDDGQCRSGVCDDAANSGAGLCRECTSVDASNCSGSTPICDTATFSCSACNGDDGTSASATCPTSSPYCPGGGEACTTCGTAGSTTLCMAAGAMHAGGTCQASGVCADLCVNDGNCMGTQWCNTDAMPASCAADLANGTAIPSIPTHTSPTLDGTCTVEVGALICASGVCDTEDDACGYANGNGPCTESDAAVVCRSGSCSSTGVCRPATGCYADDDCDASDWCDTTTDSCVAKGTGGGPIPGGGTCVGGVSSRCESGVCDDDNICGHAAGSGPCTVDTAASVCRTGLCNESAGSGGLCVECTAADSSRCSGATSACNVSTGTCSACNGDNGTSATAPCGASAPYCPGGGAACTSCGTAGETAACTDSGAIHAGDVCLASGACGDTSMPDGGMPDSGVMGDAGVPVTDGGSMDSGVRPDGGTVDSGTVTPPTVEEGGCGCDVPGRTNNAPMTGMAMLMALVGVVALRRRRR